MNQNSPRDVRDSFWCGIDWGGRFHHVCVLDHEGQLLISRNITHAVDGIGKLYLVTLSICAAGRCPVRQRHAIPTPSWRARPWRWPWPPAADGRRSGVTTKAERVIIHTDRGSTHTADAFRRLCATLGVRQSMGRVGPYFDNATANAFFSSLEWEVLSRNTFSDNLQARAVAIHWCYTFYNHQRRHSAAEGLSPVNYESRENQPKLEAAGD